MSSFINPLVLATFWGHNTYFVVALISIVSPDFQNSPTTPCGDGVLGEVTLYSISLLKTHPKGNCEFR